MNQTNSDVRSLIAGGVNRTWRGAANKRVLVEVHADPIFGTPNDGAGQMQRIAWDNQCEFCRDTDRVGYLEQGSGGRQVANRAIDCEAAKYNLCGFLDAVTSCNSCFDHPSRNMTKT